MSITQNYFINEAKYEEAQNHKILMVTKIYDLGMKIATCLSVDTVLQNRLTLAMPELKKGLKSNFYFLEDKHHPDKKQPIHQQYFDKLLKEHKVITPSYYEVL